MNEYFRHKNALLLNNDILDETLFDKEFIDLIVTSPPYNVGIEYNSNDDEIGYEQYLVFSEKWMKNCYKWSNTQARFCLNIPLDKNKNGNKAVGADLTQIAQKVGWKYKFTIIWNEGNISANVRFDKLATSAACPSDNFPCPYKLLANIMDNCKLSSSNTSGIFKLIVLIFLFFNYKCKDTLFLQL